MKHTISIVWSQKIKILLKNVVKIEKKNKLTLYKTQKLWNKRFNVTAIAFECTLVYITACTLV